LFITELLGPPRPAARGARRVRSSAGPEFDGRRAVNFVSVIIPTYQRVDWLPGLLEALAKQRFPHDRAEVIVVDEGSTDGTEALVRSWRGRLGFELRYLRKARRGAASARNHGVANARGGVLAFTDSDCLPYPEWLRNGAETIAQGAAIACGPILPVGKAGFFSAQLEGRLKDDGLYETANIFYRRADFDAAGGFDERIANFPWGDHRAGEDVDLGWRVRRLGGVAIFADTIVVEHRATPMRPLHWLLRPFVLEVFPRLLRDIPELRYTRLWRRYFLSRDTLYFELACLGLVLGYKTRYRFLILASLPWFSRIKGEISRETRKHGPVWGAAVFGLTVQRSLLMSAVLIGASIRYRRLVL
jgi:glycosyltransferase involved in cell wall biosynthesis